MNDTVSSSASGDTNVNETSTISSSSSSSSNVDATISAGSSSSSSNVDATISAGSSSFDSTTTSPATGVNAGDSNKTTSSNTRDSCTWYDDRKCSRPRTCYDCLNVLLENDECAVDPHGGCVSMSDYESYLANRYYYTPLQRYFPSSEYTYCSANDSICATCSEQWNANFASTGSAGMSSYCTGEDGCVCIADCEIPDWQDSVINDQCYSSSGSTDSGTSMATRITVSIFVGVAVAVLLAFATWGVRRFVNRRHNGSDIIRRETRTRPRPPPTGPQLSLTGWKSLRQNLIESEHGFVNGSESVTLQHDVGSSSALATADNVPEIRVEQGEGFRPASSGELEQHTQEAGQRERPTTNL